MTNSRYIQVIHRGFANETHIVCAALAQERRYGRGYGPRGAGEMLA